jgi:AraC family transcriptional regulator
MKTNSSTPSIPHSTAPPHGRNARRLAHGAFFGHVRERCDIGDATLSELQPTVPEHEIQTHTHDDAHVLLLLDGAYVSSAEDMPPVCTELAVVLNPPGTTHRDCFRDLRKDMRSDTSNPNDADAVPGRFFALSLPLSRWREASDARALPDRAIRLPLPGLVAALHLRQRLRDWDDTSALAVEADIERLLDAASIAIRPLRAAAAPAWLQRAHERLRDDSAHVPSLAELAAECGVHPVYFARAFRRRYGCSPGDELRRCRLERALAQLQNRRRSLVDIALACGFVDQSHFTHAFRRAFGWTPAQFRALR